ncbi:MAG TPA: ribosome small subunit-dependent GTPase A [Candidatus Acidoferrum sp.]|nr:ribosome small subunit-dependent GTPase A [Candidatus Acidoferrum sp.]
MSLEKFGWNSYFESEFLRVAEPGAEPGRVALADREMFAVWTESGEREASASGRLRHSGGDWPAVGDWVMLEGGARIVRVLPRLTAFSRKEAGAVTRAQVIAANIDVLFVVAGLDGDFNLRRLERYLLLARESGARPVVVLNKSDLRADAEEVATHVAALGAPVVTTSALDGFGLAALEAHIASCQTAALTGSSGVGKSTLLNRLLGSERQRVQEVRESDSRGRHTTVRRELFLAPNGWLIVDTPGLREVQLWAGAESVDLAFADIADLAEQCRFRDCRHQGEPGCAVASGGIDEARLASYAKLQREAAHLERQQNQRAAQEEKRRIKRIHRAMRGRNRG